MAEYWKKQWVKIRMGKTQAVAEIVYHKNDMEFEFYWRWRWYFKYLAAKFQVDNPRHFVELSTGSYDFVPDNLQRAKRLKDKIIKHKGLVTQANNRWAEFHKNYNSLFPITEHPKYEATAKRISQLNVELEDLENQYKTLTQNGK